MKKLLILTTLLALAALGPGSAGANLINFDGIATGTNIDGLHLGPAFPDGVVITSASGTTQVGSPVDGTDAGVGYRSYANSITNYGAVNFITPGNPMTITFDVPRGLVAFTGGDRGGDVDQFSVDAFDAGGNLLFTVTTPVFGGNTSDPEVMVDYYRLTFDNTVNFTGYIKQIVIRDAINNGIGIDDLEYCQPAPAPIPGTLLLLGSGILGLVGLKLRRG